MKRSQVYDDIKRLVNNEQMEVGGYIHSISECFKEDPPNIETSLILATICFDCMLQHGIVSRSLEPDPYKKFKKVHSIDPVIDCVNKERDYQDQQWDGHSHSAAAYHTMFQHYLTKTIEAWTVNDGDLHALDFIRKLAGISVHCLEENGRTDMVLSSHILD